VREAATSAVLCIDLLDDGESVEPDLTRFEEDASSVSRVADRGRFFPLLLAGGIIEEEGRG
jgi:hypothetical protein